MKRIPLIGTAALLLFLSGGAAAYAQDGHDAPKPEPAAKPQDAKPEAKPETRPEAKPEARPEAKPAPKPSEHAAAKPAPKPAPDENRKPEETRSAANSHPAPARTETRTTQTTRTTQSSHTETAQRGRIPDDKYRANFGREHTFHVGHPEFVGGHGRFEYGGYSFTFAQPWPTVWGYADPVYIVDIDGVYYLLDEAHPGIQLALTVVV
jgi:hypothetical protein